MRFSGTRGYSSYSGRGNKGKAFLAVLLIVIIVAALGFVFLQNHVYYDAEGHIHLRLPERPQKQKPVIDPNEVDVIIEGGEAPEPEKPENLPVFARYTSAFSITEETLQSGEEAIRTAWADGTAEPGTAAVFTIKDEAGQVWFRADAAISDAQKVSKSVDRCVRELAADEIHTIARVNVLHDPLMAKRWVTDMGLRNLDGYIYYDGSNSQWLDVSKEKTQKKVLKLLAETAELGFNEILLTDLTYPTTGDLSQIRDEDADRVETLTAFLAEIRKALPEGVLLSLELPADTIRSGGNEAAGHDLAKLVPLVDSIYTVTAEADVPELRKAVSAVSADCPLVAEVETAGTLTGQYLLLK